MLLYINLLDHPPNLPFFNCLRFFRITRSTQKHQRQRSSSPKRRVFGPKPGLSWVQTGCLGAQVNVSKRARLSQDVSGRGSRGAASKELGASTYPGGSCPSRAEKVPRAIYVGVFVCSFVKRRMYYRCR